MKFEKPIYFSLGLALLLSCQSVNQNDMPKPSLKTVLTSVAENIYLEEWSISSDDFDLRTNTRWSVRKYQLKGGKQEGVDLIEVDNGVLQFWVIPSRGMNVLKVEYEDIRLGWDSPVKEVIHPKFVNLEENNGLGWLHGFNEWMVRCGLEFAGHPGMDGGRMLTLHGKVGHLPASEVQVIIDEDPPHRIRVRGRVDEKWFNGPQLELWTEISTEPGSNQFRFDDVLTNQGDKEQEFMIIYHANFGPPLLEAGSRLYGTIERVVPFDDFAAQDVIQWHTYGPAKIDRPEQVYCIYPKADPDGNNHFLMHNAREDQGVSFRYLQEQLPYFTQWKNENTGGYVTGLEPGTGFPHNRSIERKYGRVPKLSPNENRTFSIEYSIIAGAEKVKAAKEDMSDLLDQKIEVMKEVIKK